MCTTKVFVSVTTQTTKSSPVPICSQCSHYLPNFPYNTLMGSYKTTENTENTFISDPSYLRQTEMEGEARKGRSLAQANKG